MKALVPKEKMFPYLNYLNWGKFYVSDGYKCWLGSFCKWPVNYFIVVDLSIITTGLYLYIRDNG